MINRQYQPHPPLTQATPQYPQQYAQPYPAPIMKVEIKPTWSLAWGLLWRMWICCVPVYIALLILNLATK